MLLTTGRANRPERPSVTAKFKSQIDELLPEYDLGYRKARPNRFVWQADRLNHVSLSWRGNQ